MTTIRAILASLSLLVLQTSAGAVVDVCDGKAQAEFDANWGLLQLEQTYWSIRQRLCGDAAVNCASKTNCTVPIGSDGSTLSLLLTPAYNGAQMATQECWDTSEQMIIQCFQQNTLTSASAHSGNTLANYTINPPGNGIYKRSETQYPLSLALSASPTTSGAMATASNAPGYRPHCQFVTIPSDQPDVYDLSKECTTFGYNSAGQQYCLLLSHKGCGMVMVDLSGNGLASFTDINRNSSRYLWSYVWSGSSGSTEAQGYMQVDGQWRMCFMNPGFAGFC